MFATVNPAEGNPVVVRFDLPIPVLQELMAPPGQVIEYVSEVTAYQFLTPSFPTVNREMTNVTTMSVTMPFEE
jgi:hypothetical protein